MTSPVKLYKRPLLVCGLYLLSVACEQAAPLPEQASGRVKPTTPQTATRSPTSRADPRSAEQIVRAQLNAQFGSAWTFMEPDDDARKEMKELGGAMWVAGDFNGDGQMDYAAQALTVRRPGSTPESTLYLLAFLRRAGTFEVASLDSLRANRRQYLRRAPRGQIHPGDEESASVSVRLPFDAIMQVTANSAVVTYVYDGLTRTWRRLVSGD